MNDRINIPCTHFLPFFFYFFSLKNVAFFSRIGSHHTLRTKKVNLCINILSLKFRYWYLKFGGTLSLIIRMIKKKTKIGYGIKQKACYRPNFKTWKTLSSWTNKQEICHTHSQGALNFSPKRHEACSFLINQVICRKPPWRIKTSMSLTQKGS